MEIFLAHRGFYSFPRSGVGTRPTVLVRHRSYSFPRSCVGTHFGTLRRPVNRMGLIVSTHTSPEGCILDQPRGTRSLAAGRRSVLRAFPRRSVGTRPILSSLTGLVRHRSYSFPRSCVGTHIGTLRRPVNRMGLIVSIHSSPEGCILNLPRGTRSLAAGRRSVLRTFPRRSVGTRPTVLVRHRSYSFPRSGVGTHIGTLRRPVNPMGLIVSIHSSPEGCILNLPRGTRSLAAGRRSVLHAFPRRSVGTRPILSSLTGLVRHRSYSFPRSGVGTHIGTLRRPVNPMGLIVSIHSSPEGCILNLPRGTRSLAAGRRSVLRAFPRRSVGTRQLPPISPSPHLPIPPSP